MTVISIGNVDNVDYFQTKREGNRFDVLSHDEFGSSLTSLYAVDAKAAVRWCRRIRKAVDEWEQTKAKLHQMIKGERVYTPGAAAANEPMSSSMNRSRSDEEAGAPQSDAEDDDPGADNVDEVLGQLAQLEPEEDEPQEDPPDVGGEAVDEEQQILRDRQRAETGVETKQVLESGKNIIKQAAHDQDFERKFAAKKAELEKAIQALEDDAHEDDFEDEQEAAPSGQPENQRFDSLQLPSLVDIFSQLQITEYLSNFTSNRLSSLDLLEMTSARLASLIPAKGPRGRLGRYLQPFLNTRAETESARQLKQLERSLERIGAELTRVGQFISRLDVVLHAQPTKA